MELKEDLADRVARRTDRPGDGQQRCCGRKTSSACKWKNVCARKEIALETITGNLGAGLAVISSDERILWANRILKDIFGQVEGKSCFETLYKDLDRAEFKTRRVFENGCEKVMREHQGRDANGNPIWAQIITTPIRDTAGGVSAALELVLPITDLKKAREEKQRLSGQLEEARKFEAIATLAGGMAHQLNNSLAVIMGNSELLKHDYGNTNGIAVYLNPLLQSARQMAGLTDQLLAYAKGGKYKAKLTDMHAFISDTLALVEHTLPTGITLGATIAEQLPQVKIDVTQMQMALSAVLANSSEVMVHGGRIQIICRTQMLSAAQSASFSNMPPGEGVALTIWMKGWAWMKKPCSAFSNPFSALNFRDADWAWQRSTGLCGTTAGILPWFRNREKGPR